MSPPPDASGNADPGWRPLGTAALVGALCAVGLHLVTVLALFLPAFGGLTGQIRSELTAIRGHLLATQLALVVGIALAGAGFGLATRGVLAALGWRQTRTRLAVGTAIGILAQLLRTLARRPALFEDWLWRKGGIRAGFQVLVVETLGARLLDRLFVIGLSVVVAIGLWRAWRRWSRARWAGVVAVAVLGLVALFLPLRRVPPARRTSVIILAADSLRPDHFSSEGYPRKTTPSIDALRPQGLWASDLYSPIASTTAAWSSLLTGTYPHRHGVRDLFPRAAQTVVRGPTLPRLLGQAGYRSAVVSDYAGESFQRVHFGFDVVDAPPATSVEVFADREAFLRAPLALGLLTGAWGQSWFPVGRYLPDNADPALLTDRVLSAIDTLSSSGSPIFVVAFYSVTHLPFAVPMPEAALYTERGYQGPSRYSYELQQLDSIGRLSERPSDAEIAQVRGLYDGALQSFDAEVARVSAHLDAIGLTDRILVVTGDHGEGLFEPGTTTEHGKWFAGGESANRTPLLMVGKGISPGTLTGVASGVDLMPTLLEAVGVGAPDGLDGRSILHGIPEDRPVFAETALWLGGPKSAPPGALTYPPLLQLLEVEEGTHALVLKRQYLERSITAKLRAVRQGPWQLVYLPTDGAPRWTLFDLAHDPYGERDVAGEHPAVFAALREQLLGWLAQDRLRWLDANDRVVPRREQ